MEWDAAKFTGFDWDAGNQAKSLDKHAVSGSEAEQVFLNAPLKILFDPAHSKTEPRFHAFGQTDAGRRLTVAFTGRGPSAVISVKVAAGIVSPTEMVIKMFLTLKLGC